MARLPFPPAHGPPPSQAACLVASSSCGWGDAPRGSPETSTSRLLPHAPPQEYVGNVAVIAGFKEERKRGRDYLTWLLTQRRGIVQVDTRARDDVTAVEVPRETVGFITGHKGEGLREIERLTGTFIFSDGERGGSRSNPGYESILVFGASKAVREEGCGKASSCAFSRL